MSISRLKLHELHSTSASSMGIVSPQRKDSLQGTRDRLNLVLTGEARGCRSMKLQFFPTQDRWSGASKYLRNLTPFPGAAVPPQGAWSPAGRYHHGGWKIGPISLPGARAVAGCVRPLLSPAKPSPAPSQSLAGWRYLSVSILGACGAMPLNGGAGIFYTFSILRACQLSMLTCQMSQTVLREMPLADPKVPIWGRIPGGWATMWTPPCTGLPLLALIWLPL